VNIDFELSIGSPTRAKYMGDYLVHLRKNVDKNKDLFLVSYFGEIYENHYFQTI